MLNERSIQRLHTLTSFPSIITYLRDELDWEIATENVEEEDLADLTFEYTPQELEIDERFAAKVTRVRQLRDLIRGQPWGIFYIEFEQKRLPVTVLRRILAKLVRANADRRGWNMEDLLFICTQGAVGQRGVAFAHFRKGDNSRLPELRTFSWDSRETHFYYLTRLNLEALRWPRDPRNQQAWRDQWRAAFQTQHGEVIADSRKLASAMAQQAQQIRELVEDLFLIESKEGALHRLFGRFQEDLLHDLTPDRFADVIAQTITYGLFSAAEQNANLSFAQVLDYVPNTNPFLKDLLKTLIDDAGIDLSELGVDRLVEMLSEADVPQITQDFMRQTGSGEEDPVVHFYEQFLNEYDRRQRVERGVFYTPDPVVSYIVRSVDYLLEKAFGLSDGLASAERDSSGEHLVQILDPATGTGTFLQYIIQEIAARRNPNNRPSAAWNQYVTEHLLPRLNGFELMMAPYTIAHMKLGLKLKYTGYDLRDAPRLHVYLTNALELPHTDLDRGMTRASDPFAREALDAAAVKRDKPIMIVIGNPPYSGHSSNNSVWIANLLRGVDLGGETDLSAAKIRERKRTQGGATASYYEVDGQPLGESNPKWLQDDYVKFIRFGQWRIEQSGKGILAFITNHGYLDNPTFRGMRQALMGTFDDIYIIDLHGSIKKKETAPGGGKDENIFDIKMGVSIGIFVKRGEGVKSPARVHHLHLYGTRKHKYDTLRASSIADIELTGSGWRTFTPDAPFYLFTPQNVDLREEYDQGWRVTDVLPVNVLGFQTHRDEFAIDLDRAALHRRISDMRSTDLSDEAFRQLYSVADNRDWKLSTSRGRLRGTDDWERNLIDCLYRPFDRRACYFSEIAMDYPRRELLRHVVGKQNLCLNVVRQTKEVEWRHAFVSDSPTPAVFIEIKDGSSVLPLYTYPDPASPTLFDAANWPPGPQGRTPNLNPDFVREVAARLGLAFVSDGRGDLDTTFGPEDIFHYAYAVFHSPEYRSRYAEFLKIDFPRLPLTSDRALFRELAGLGARLVDLHLLRVPVDLVTGFPVDGTNEVATGYPKYDEGQRRVYVNKAQYVSDVAPEVWAFQVGGYQVLDKWLKDRRGRALTYDDITHYQRVVAVLSETITLMAQIDIMIEAHGGFPLRGSTGSTSAETTRQAAPDEADEDSAMSRQDWQEEQPKLFYVEGDQLPLAESPDLIGDGGDVELDPQKLRDAAIELTREAIAQTDGLDVEQDENGEPLHRPFDPSKIRMTSQQMSLDILIKRMQDGRISIPSYQRAENIWNATKKSRLIESILIKIPLPAFYIDASDEDNWRIIDGLQRLTTLRQFVIEKSLRLSSLEFLQQFDKAGFAELPRNMQRRIEETQVTVYFVQEGTPIEVTYNIFKRINTGGEVLSPQEIRNAIHDRGHVVEYLGELADSTEFKRATGNSIKTLRKADQEVVLRFLAFALAPDRRPPSNDIDQFMNESMKQINGLSQHERDALRARFLRAMDAAHKILGEYAFRKIMESGRRGQISRALFDAWAMNFDALSDEQIVRLKQKRPSSRLLGRFRDLLKTDDQFNRAITASTGDPANVDYRYKAIEQLINITLGGQ